MKQLSVVVAFVLTAITAFNGFAGEAPQQDEEPPTLSAICSPEHAAVDEAFKRDYSGLTPFCELRPDQQRIQLNKATAAVREHFNPRCASLTPRNRGNKNRICFPVVEGFELSVMAANTVELLYESDPHTGGSNTHGLYRLGRIVDGFERRVTAIYHPTETTNKALHLTLHRDVRFHTTWDYSATKEQVTAARDAAMHVAIRSRFFDWSAGGENAEVYRGIATSGDGSLILCNKGWRDDEANTVGGRSRQERRRIDSDLADSLSNLIVRVLSDAWVFHEYC